MVIYLLPVALLSSRSQGDASENLPTAAFPPNYKTPNQSLLFFLQNFLFARLIKFSFSNKLVVLRKTKGKHITWCYTRPNPLVLTYAALKWVRTECVWLLGTATTKKCSSYAPKPRSTKFLTYAHHGSAVTSQNQTRFVQHELHYVS